MPRMACSICANPLGPDAWTPTVCSPACVDDAAAGLAPRFREVRGQLTLEEAWAQAPPQPAAAAVARATTLDAFTAPA